jgi:hypothetical protein
MNISDTKPIQINAGITLYDTMVMGFVWSVFSMIPLSIFFIWLRHFKIRLYTITKREILNRIQKRVKDHSSHTSEEDRGHGYALGKWYFAYISSGSNDEYAAAWMIATEASYEALIKDADDGESIIIIGPSGESIETSAKKLDIYDRHGSYTNIWYRKRHIKNFDFVARPEQATIIEDIKKYYSTHKNVVVFLHGAPCTGKSIVGLLLADMYGSGYCNSFAPWEPGDHLGQLIEDAEPTKEKPLIIAMDEIDIALASIHKEIPLHKNIHIETRDKTGWNRFMDNIQRGLFPYVILLLTSNKTPEEIAIATRDPSYLRPGRVNLFCKMEVKAD